MGYEEIKAAKQIGKKLKAKGFGKPHLYCQMCRKQCRDNVGFKNHETSEKHLQNMKQFSENPDYWIKRFSDEFERGMLDIVKVRGRSDWVSLERIYSEYRKARNQTRLNGTRWTELEEFASYLKEKGNAYAEERKDEGWYLKWKGTDTNVIEKEKKLQKNRKVLTEEEREYQMIENRLKNVEKNKNNNNQNENQNEKGQAQNNIVNLESINEINLSLKQDKLKEKKNPEKKKVNPFLNKTKKLKLENNNPNCWLFENIIVKIISSDSKFKNRKGKIISVDSKKLNASLQLENQIISDIHQDELETVIPSYGKEVLILKGKYKGEKGIFLNIDEENYQALVKIGDEKKWFEYEEISKYEL